MRNDLLEFLIGCSRRGETVVAYGAPGKGNTLLNHCGIRSDLVRFSVDRNPFKHGRFLPGTHIPIRPVEELAPARPDYVLIMPWNLREEICAQLAPVVGDWGGRLVVALPHLEVIEVDSSGPVQGGSRMKVVLFCGGLGMRMRSGPESVPKPMMPIGSRPVLWHVMRYYAHFGHTEFILALGFGAQSVKDYFLHYEETASNDFVLTKGGAHVELLGSDISDWTITFIDTGMDTPIGERLRRVRPYLEDDEVFLANYGDVLTDAPMNQIIDGFLPTDAVGSLLAVRPQDSFHVVGIGADCLVSGFEPVADKSFRINGGYFVLRQEIFDYMGPDQDLVMDACVNAAADGRMRAVEYDGFWAPMDTLKERSHPRGDVPPRRMPLGAVAGGPANPAESASTPVEGDGPGGAGVSHVARTAARR